MKRLVLILSALFLLCSCGSEGEKTSTPPAISVLLAPATQTNIDMTQTVNFTATVANDSSGKGVTWSVSGTACSGSACGNFTNTTATTATYNGPSSVSASLTVSVTATSVADTTKSASSAVVINPAPIITTTSLPDGAVGTAYSATLQASGGASTLTWSMASGSTLPADLSLSSSGALSGTPTAPGSSTFTVKVTDSSGAQGGPLSATQQLNLTIKPATLTITTTSLSNGVVGTAYSASLAATGGTGAISWSVTGGSLPTGLNLGSSGAISGTPTASGTSNFTVTATDSGTPPQNKMQALSITINPVLSITTTSLPSGTVTTAYSQNIQTSGGTPPIAWSVTSGTLPAGLALTNGANGVGVISGTPTAYGSSTFTVKATDSSTPPQTVSQQFTIVINNVALSITTTSLPNGTENTAYSAPLQASGGAPPYTWTVASGSTLPGWLTLSGSGTNWNLTGTPTTAGSASFSLTVTDSSSPAQSKTVALSITIAAPSTACGTGNEKILKGQYAFTLSGFNSSGFQAAIGSFTADGEGHITAGMVDSNGVSPGVNSGSIAAGSSSYSVGSDNRGCATIETPFYTYTTRFALAPTSSVASAGTVQEWESGTSPFIASGQIFLQNVPSQAPGGTWVFQAHGIYGLSNQYRIGFIGSGGGGSGGNGEYDVNVESKHFNYTSVSGTSISTFDPTTGRGTASTTLAKGTTLNLVGYLVSSTYLIELTTDTLADGIFLAIGDGQAQNSSFTLTTGQNLVFYGTGLEDAEFAVVSITSSSSLSANIFHDVEGTWTSPSPGTATCDYTIDTYGRVAPSGTDCGLYFNGTSWSYPPVFYLTGPNTGVMLGTNDPGVLIGQLAPQSATSITASTYYIGTQEVVNLDVNETLTGEAAITSSGSVTGIGDSTAIGAIQNGGLPLSTTLTVNPDGTFSASNNPGVVMGVIISDSQLVQVDGQNSTYPTILIFNSDTGD